MSETAVAPIQPERLEAGPPKYGRMPPVPARRVGWREKTGFMAMVFGMFMAILDIQIVASSLSELQAGLSAGPDEIAWIQTSYLIAEVIMIPLSGWLARLMSTRWLYLTSVTGFTIASAACAFAGGLGSMVVFRALQGFLGGAMIPSVFATSFTIFPPEQRARMSVLIGLTATLAPTLGPTLGGWITANMSWHWLFLINVIPGILVGITVFRFVHFDRPNWHLLKRFDYIGIISVALFLGSLEYVLEEGVRDDWFASDVISFFSILAAISAIVFFWRELACENPVINLRAFKDRNFAIGCAFAFVIGIGLYGAVYVIPLFLGRVSHYDSLEIGIVMMVTGMFQFVAAPMAGNLVRRLDPRVMLGIGFSLFALALWLNARLTADTGYWDLFLPQALRGMALMFCFVPVNAIALGLLPPEQLKNASGLYNLMRNLGGALGLATINTIVIDRFSLHQQRLAEAVTGSRPQVQAYIDSIAARFESLVPADPSLVAMKLLSGIVQREATVMTFSDALLVIAAVFVAALAMIPLLKRVSIVPGASSE